MNQNNIIRLIISFFLIASNLSAFAQDKKKLLAEHTKVAILPAYYFDRTETSKLGDQAQQLKLLSQFKKEIGVDVQYKFYLPVMQYQENYKPFFRGADTINQILDSNSVSTISYESVTDRIDFKKLAELLNVDAVVILELTETNVHTGRDISNIFLTILSPSPGLLGKVIDAGRISTALNDQTVALKLTAKIYDCSTGILVWSHYSTVKDRYYHDGVREMTELLLKKIPYRVNKK